MAQGVKETDDINTLYCTPCGFRENKILAVIWCFDCKEGLCTSCKAHHESSKLLSAHVTIDSKNRHSLPVLQDVKYTCIKHSKKFDFYCSDHQVPCCVKCIPCSHQTCTQLITIEEAAGNVKTSAALSSVEDTLKSLLFKVEAVINGKEACETALPDQRKTVVDEVEKLKENAIQNIRKSASNLIDELDQHIDQYKIQSKEVLEKLRSHVCAIKTIMTQLTLLKENASNLQIFLALKYLESLVLTEIKYLDDLELNGNLRNICLQFTQNVRMSSESYYDMGWLSKLMSNLDVDLTAQNYLIVQKKTSIINPLIHDLEAVKLTECMEINFPANCKVTNCVILENGGMIFTDFSGSNGLMIFNCNGNFLRNVPTTSAPFDIAVISDFEVVLTLTESKKLSFVELITDNVTKEISLEHKFYGLGFNGNLIVVSMRDSGIVILDRHGTVRRMLNNPCVGICCSISHICFLKEQSDLLECCDFLGAQVWQKQLDLNQEALRSFHSVASDSQGNIFVCDFQCDKLFLVSKDGNKCKELLTRDCGLYDTGGLHFHEQKNLLLICAQWTANAKLYKIE